MDFHLHGGSPSSTSSSSSHHRHPNNSNNSAPNGHSSDPMHSWWESISRARSRIHLLSSLLPSSAATSDEDPLSSLADTDRPARSLLLSSAAYSSLSSALSAASSGSADDPLCHWLYDTYLSSDPDLRLVVLSALPLIASVYLHRIHHPDSDAPSSLSGFEAVLLALYTSETKARNGKAVTVSIPDLSQPSLYHAPRNPNKSSTPDSNPRPSIGVLSPPLEPQMAVKSTKRACIVGVALDCYYKQISQMPSWSKLDFCKFAAVWAGGDCPCTSDFDGKPESFVEKNEGRWSENGFGDDIRVEADDMDFVAERIKDLEIENGDSADIGGEDLRIPLPWEMLQPVLRILGHCLLGPLNVDEVKDAASVAVRRLYARASHDLVPQAILATRSLIQLDKGTREAAMAVAAAAANGSGSNVNTPSKAKKPEILLVSK
ncbi:uncharacterized protein LOC131019440 [Salvia miltiorrhiza]|uniref:uncharacterized protein LOC131019440 n=1 Tax=Salvia miltiorrhiza TaxID=226208 RepID=UPI0025ACED97|nr:uncharacterized protein LOC131019440 [Salvia miltiorrhiza]